MRVARDQVGEPLRDELERDPLRRSSQASVNAGRRDLDERSGRDEGSKAMEIGLDLGIPLRMGEDRNQPVELQSEDSILKVEGPPAIGELGQHVAAPGEREAPDFSRLEQVEPVECDLTSTMKLERDLFGRERRSEFVDELLHPLGRGWEVGAHVRRGRDGRDPVSHRSTREREALRERSGPVVDAGEDVRVEIDHGRRRA